MEIVNQYFIIVIFSCFLLPSYHSYEENFETSTIFRKHYTARHCPVQAVINKSPTSDLKKGEKVLTGEEHDREKGEAEHNTIKTLKAVLKKVKSQVNGVDAIKVNESQHSTPDNESEDLSQRLKHQKVEHLRRKKAKNFEGKTLHKSKLKEDGIVIQRKCHHVTWFQALKHFAAKNNTCIRRSKIVQFPKHSISDSNYVRESGSKESDWPSQEAIERLKALNLSETSPNASTVGDTSDDAKEKDQLETYSQFAERVKAEKKTVSSTTTNGHGSNGQPSKEPKVKSKNYASTDCGAKFLAANPDASHSSKIINSNKDEYMLNKCTEKIWAVIEMCESIHPQMFEIANFELFSNSPKDIKVFGSRRFPTRDWAPLGSYAAEEGNRDIQAFHVASEQEFYKYIKLEIHSYYGTEFFCPLSMFRIFGLSEFEVIEDNDDAEEHLAEEEKDQVVNVEQKKEKRGMIPEVIHSMLNGVYNAIKRGSLSGNITSSPEINNYAQNCRSLAETLSIKDETCASAESLNYILACYYDEYFDLMKRPLFEITRNKYFCRDLAKIICSSLNYSDNSVYESICQNSYACVILSPEHVLSMCHMQDTTLISRAMEGCAWRSSSTSSFTDVINATVNESSFTNRSLYNATSIFLRRISKASLASSLPTAKRNGIKTGKAPPIGDSSRPSISSPGSQTHKGNSSHSSVHDSKSEEKKSMNGKKSVKEPSEKKSHNGVSESSAHLRTKEPSRGNIADKKTGTKPEAPGNYSGSNQPSSPPLTTPSPTPETKVVSSNKESIVVRLSNRVKALEHNISISSQYLEELSRRYKRQMEEMQHQFNLTILALNLTTHEAYERDLQHQKRLKTIELQLEGLVITVAVFERERDDLMSRVVEQHLIFLGVHIVVFGVLFWWCFRRRREYRLTHSTLLSNAASRYTQTQPSGYERSTPVEQRNGCIPNGVSSKGDRKAASYSQTNKVTFPKLASTDSGHKFVALGNKRNNKFQESHPPSITKSKFISAVSHSSVSCKRNSGNGNNVKPLSYATSSFGQQKVEDISHHLRAKCSSSFDVDCPVVISDLSRTKVSLNEERMSDVVYQVRDDDLPHDIIYSVPAPFCGVNPWLPESLPRNGGLQLAPFHDINSVHIYNSYFNTERCANKRQLPEFADSANIKLKKYTSKKVPLFTLQSSVNPLNEAPSEIQLSDTLRSSDLVKQYKGKESVIQRDTLRSSELVRQYKGKNSVVQPEDRSSNESEIVSENPWQIQGHKKKKNKRFRRKPASDGFKF